MPRGGSRQGTPGASYATRTDLQSVKVASGQPYGARAEQVAAQRALPLAGATSPGPPPAPQGGGASGGSSLPPGPLPGQVVPLDAPSTRPNEPITAGMDMGAGPGSSALGALAGGDDTDTQLRAIYSRFPNEDLRRVIEMLDTDDGSGLR